MKSNGLLILTALAVVGGLTLAPAGNLMPPVAPPIASGRAPGNTCAPPHWIPKQPGHYSLDDWRRVIDSTWGPGLPVDRKLAIFDTFWNTIDQEFACFNNLSVNWDSLRTVYRTEIEDTVSRGRFASIMKQLALALRESHTNISDDSVINRTALLPGVPLWIVGAWWDVGHFGAGLTPLPDSSLLVYRVVDSHPVGLERGDVVLGYDRRPWAAILRELQEAQLPISRHGWWGSSSSSMTHSMLMAAGMNWHLFDTIDIAKYSTGDTVHLPTSLLVGQNMDLVATEQLDVPGVPMPDPSTVQAVSYGVVSGTRVGYIYVWRWWDYAQSEFLEAVDALVSDTTLKGMIIDFRYNEGGNMFMSNPGLELLFRDSVETVIISERSDPHDHFAMRVAWPASSYVIPGNGMGYDKPIAVLVGPGAVSSGDQVAFRMTFHDRARTFGRSTSTAFNAPTSLSLPTEWYADYAAYEASLAADTTYFLTHREFPVDCPVWHTRDAVARGEDTVVTAAMAWIDSGGAIAEVPQPTTHTAQLAATIVRGVLVLGAVGSRQNTAYRDELLDISGRAVMTLRPGANDVRALAPGVYFVRQAPGVELDASCVTKVVVTR
jgi:hypothetical protein